MLYIHLSTSSFLLFLFLFLFFLLFFFFFSFFVSTRFPAHTHIPHSTPLLFFIITCSFLSLPLPLHYNNHQPSLTQAPSPPLHLLLTHKDERHVHDPGALPALTAGPNPHSSNSPCRSLHAHYSNIRNPLDSRPTRLHHPPLHRQSWSVHKTNRQTPHHHSPSRQGRHLWRVHSSRCYPRWDSTLGALQGD